MNFKVYTRKYPVIDIPQQEPDKSIIELHNAGQSVAYIHFHLNGPTKHAIKQTLKKYNAQAYAQTLEGLRVGKLTVLELVGVIRERKGLGRKRKVYKCKCDCNGENSIIEVQDVNLYSKRTTSCGCIKQNRLPAGTIGFRKHLLHYKDGARVRGLAWDLTDQQFADLTTQACHYCGQPPSIVSALPRKSYKTEAYYKHTIYVCNGIDRVNNEQGYTVENCVTCCTQCNISKADLTPAQFVDWLIRLTANVSVLRTWVGSLPSS